MNSNPITKRFFIMLCYIVCLTWIQLHCAAADNQQDVKAELEKRIKAWGDYIGKKFYLSDLTGNKYYRDIIDLGTPAVPYMVEKIEEGCWPLGDAVTVITKKRFEEYEQPEYHVRDSKSTAAAVAKWWPKARKETPHQFNQRYSQWKDLKKQGKEKEAKEKLEEIRALGIASLPIIIEKVKQGDNELIPIVSKLTDGQVDPNANTSQCVSWWQQNKEQWLIPFPNKKPKANAGKDMTVTSGDTVKLDASASSDPDKDELKYKWTQIAGPSVTLSDNTALKPTFTAPVVEQQTVLTFQLTVNDGSPKKSVHPSCESGESNPNTVNITVKPKG